MEFFCQGTLNSEMIHRTMNPKAVLASSDSHTITNMIENDHIRLNFGQTSNQNFIFGKFASHQTLRRELSGEILDFLS